MKFRKSFKSLLALLTLLQLGSAGKIQAEQLTSPNYLINGAAVDSAGEPVSGSGTFNLHASVGDFSGDQRLFSTSYQARPGSIETFTANTPAVSCFETVTDGSSACTSGPSYLNSNGMVRVCGPNGCYNRARFEIDIQENPDDTLYAIQISSDDFVSNLSYIDGSSYQPKAASARQLSDYKTKSDWETPTFNIEGLQPATQYWIRVVALHGDFTESQPGPTETATTASATISYDIDITDTSQTPSESGPPYTLSFTGDHQLFQGGAAQSADNLIWMDINTNANGGVAIVQKGLYGGLFSPASPYTITSATANLLSTLEGFGLQNYDYSGTALYQVYHNGSGNGSLGAISVETNYNGAGENVGQVSTSFLKVYDGNGPIHTGRTGLYVKARATTSTPTSTDYTEDITFVAVGRY